METLNPKPGIVCQRGEEFLKDGLCKEENISYSPTETQRAKTSKVFILLISVVEKLKTTYKPTICLASPQRSGPENGRESFMTRSFQYFKGLAANHCQKKNTKLVIAFEFQPMNREFITVSLTVKSAMTVIR